MPRTFIFVLFSVLLMTLFSCTSRENADLPADETQVVKASNTPVPTQSPTSTPAPDFTALDKDASPLRIYAQQNNFTIGAAVADTPLKDEALYGETLAREFNMVTAENVMKFENIHPAQDTYDFEAGDALVSFAKENGMQVRGHVLVWHNQLPEWLTSAEWSREELLEVLHDHISTVVSHYKGQISAWDVVNEAITDNGTMRNSIWYKTIGPEYIDLAFQWAHEADPETSLFYNDYGAEGIGRKSMAVYELVSDMLERGIPVYGVGLQMHTELHTSPNLDEVRQNINQIAELGLVVHITEMDIRILLYPDDADLIKQAQIYYDITQMCLELDACKALVFWGFTDKYSWIPYANKGFGAALPFDEDYKPKPAYNAVLAALAGR